MCLIQPIVERFILDVHRNASKDADNEQRYSHPVCRLDLNVGGRVASQDSLDSQLLATDDSTKTLQPFLLGVDNGQRWPREQNDLTTSYQGLSTADRNRL